jgi:integrase
MRRRSRYRDTWGKRQYGLRHMHTTLLLEDGVSVSAISKRLRHAHVTVTAPVHAHETAPGAASAAACLRPSGLILLNDSDHRELWRAA